MYCQVQRIKEISRVIQKGNCRCKMPPRVARAPTVPAKKRAMASGVYSPKKIALELMPILRSSSRSLRAYTVSKPSVQSTVAAQRNQVAGWMSSVMALQLIRTANPQARERTSWGIGKTRLARG